MTAPADTDALVALLRECRVWIAGANDSVARVILLNRIESALTAAQQICTPCCGKFSACSQPCSPRADYWQEKATLCDEFAAQQKAQEDEMTNTPKQGAEPICCCGEPMTLGVVHRKDKPCFHWYAHDAEPVALPCCGYADASAVKWNEFNKVIQCHNCGHIYSPAPPSGIAAGMEVAEICRKSKLFAQFLDQNFWHAHHVDIVWRMDGKDIVEEGDWLKSLWYAIRAAIPQAGEFVVVPRKPTDAMLDAGNEILEGRITIYRVWNAMLAAATGKEEGK